MRSDQRETFFIFEQDNVIDFKERSLQSRSRSDGNHGEQLAIVDLGLRGIESVLWNGEDVDVLADVNGYKTFQVKGSWTKSFGTGGLRNANSPKKQYLSDYKVDAFAFSYFPLRTVYYIAIEAMPNNTRSITIDNLGMQSCNLSFAELLRRWNGPC